mgnify:CR=1 FL=1
MPDGDGQAASTSAEPDTYQKDGVEPAPADSLRRLLGIGGTASRHGEVVRNRRSHRLHRGGIHIASPVADAMAKPRPGVFSHTIRIYPVSLGSTQDGVRIAAVCIKNA